MLVYDTIIIGAGPSGLTASIYASCYGLHHLVIAKTLGGQLLRASDIRNYPGFEQTVAGRVLAANMLTQARALGGEIKEDEVIEIVKIADGFGVKTRSVTFLGKTVILATGTERRKLNVPGEQEYAGRGVYYCATCAVTVYEGKDVTIIGGANSAYQSAIHVAEKARSVLLLVRSQVRADPYLVEQVASNRVIRVLTQSTLREIRGDATKVSGIIAQTEGNKDILDQFASLTIQAQDGELTTWQRSMDVVFVEIGGVPGAMLLAPLGVALTDHGYVIVNHKLETSVPFIFAAGDIVGDELSMEQISTAVGLGARAAASCFVSLRAARAPLVWGKARIGGRDGQTIEK